MNLLPGLNWLTAITWRRASAADGHGPDPADMGTAFGLDASMEPEPVQSAPRPATAPPEHNDRLIRRPRR
jgi:hypothetical protein